MTSSVAYVLPVGEKSYGIANSIHNRQLPPNTVYAACECRT
jgi:hypothetical protein